MFDHYSTVQKAYLLTQQASEIRTQARKLGALCDIVGNTYSGKDAQAYYDSVRAAQSELLSIASELDNLFARVKGAADQVQKEQLLDSALT